MDETLLKSIVLMLAAALVAGCNPNASGSLTLPADTTNAQLFGCAETTLFDLREADEHWTTHVTLQDTGRGLIETGNFPDPNVMGYRVRVVREGNTPRAVIHVRSAGPYFTDLGAKDAVDTLRTSVSACLEAAYAAR